MVSRYIHTWSQSYSSVRTCGLKSTGLAIAKGMLQKWSVLHTYIADSWRYIYVL